MTCKEALMIARQNAIRRNETIYVGIQLYRIYSFGNRSNGQVQIIQFVDIKKLYSLVFVKQVAFRKD